MVSRVSASVITTGVYQVARCGKQSTHLCCYYIGIYQVARCDKQSVYLCYYYRCISGSKVW